MTDDRDDGDGRPDQTCSCGGGCSPSDDAVANCADGDDAHAAVPESGPPDPQLDPARSPGFGGGPGSLAEIEVSRDVTLGEATPEELTVSDTAPVADASVRTLIEALTDGDAVARGRAALALAERPPSGPVVAALARTAGTDDDADVRQFSVEAIAKLAGRSGEAQPTGAAETVEALPTADAAAVSETAEAVALAATRDDDPWVRAEGVVALDRLDRAAHVDRLEAALADEHHAVRRNALISLFKLGGEGTLEALLDAAADPNDRVREWAAHLLAGVDDERAARALGRLLDDEVELVALTASHALSVDPDRFRRRFTGPLTEGQTVLPGEDLLNRQPDL
ncbi:MAG: HEAT repeat domain-containing protein [Salinigranum sp.]